MFTDSHCHLSFPELHAQLPQIRAAMRTAQVDRALCICTTLEEFETVHALAVGHNNFWCTVGVHPDNEQVLEPSLDALLSRAARPKVVGIGETGLDYYRLGERSVADMEWQRERFRVHIRAARHSDKPLVIHTRSASSDTLAILKEEGGSTTPAGGQGIPTTALAFNDSPNSSNHPAARGVFHCFTETLTVARAALDLGFYISFSGILTFKNAADLREVARFVPLDRLLIETDSPYLAPVPYRGKTNNPSLVPYVAQHIAEVRGISTAAVAEATSKNFELLFTDVKAVTPVTS